MTYIFSVKERIVICLLGFLLLHVSAGIEGAYAFDHAGHASHDSRSGHVAVAAEATNHSHESAASTHGNDSSMEASHHGALNTGAPSGDCLGEHCPACFAAQMPASCSHCSLDHASDRRAFFIPTPHFVVRTVLSVHHETRPVQAEAAQQVGDPNFPSGYCPQMSPVLRL